MGYKIDWDVKTTRDFRGACLETSGCARVEARVARPGDSYVILKTTERDAFGIESLRELAEFATALADELAGVGEAPAGVEKVEAFEPITEALYKLKDGDRFALTEDAFPSHRAGGTASIQLASMEPQEYLNIVLQDVGRCVNVTYRPSTAKWLRDRLAEIYGPVGS